MIRAKWVELVQRLGELPAMMKAAEVDAARESIRSVLGEVRVDREGKGYCDLGLQRMVAGVGFEPTTFGL